jgi:hypothetical protein
MSAKIHDDNGLGYWCFHCPGCGHDHAFRVNGTGRPQWTWNGSLEKPTFTPSLVNSSDTPSRRCHLFVTKGRIQFLSDCHHALAGQTVDLPDWDAKP